MIQYITISDETVNFCGFRCATTSPRTVFSEGKLTFTFAICRRPLVCLSSVCLSSVTFVRPTQAIEIFVNFSTPFGTLAICDLSIKILRRLPQGNPSVGGLHRRGVVKYSDFEPFPLKRCNTEGKLLLITNRKSHMSFRSVPKSVTLKTLNSVIDLSCVISPNSDTFCGRNVGQRIQFLVIYHLRRYWQIRRYRP